MKKIILLLSFLLISQSSYSMEAPPGLAVPHTTKKPIHSRSNSLKITRDELKSIEPDCDPIIGGAMACIFLCETGKLMLEREHLAKIKADAKYISKDAYEFAIEAREDKYNKTKKALDDTLSCNKILIRILVAELCVLGAGATAFFGAQQWYS